MKIGTFDLREDILVIAEIGNNHEGSYTLAEEMIGLAAEAGAGAVKFQTIVPTRLVSAGQKERVRQLEGFRLTYEQFEKLAGVARKEGVLFLSTPFDLESARFLDSLVPAHKIASGDNTFYPLIQTVALTGKPVLLSCGGTDLEEIRRTRDFIRGVWQVNRIEQDMALLHCVISYPTPAEQANLLAVETLRQLEETVGYSDHTLGTQAAVLSVALGARIVEKHFTKDKRQSSFRDHQLSADPGEFSTMVEGIREAAVLLGKGTKGVLACEQDILPAVRRSVVAAADLPSGTRLDREHISWVRPGGGLPPGREEEVLGKVLNRPLKEGERIRVEDAD